MVILLVFINLVSFKVVKLKVVAGFATFAIFSLYLAFLNVVFFFI